MIVTYTISTPMMHDATQIAIRRAKAEGWRSASVIAVNLVGQGTYEVRLVVTK